MPFAFQQHTVQPGQRASLQFTSGARPPLNVIILAAGGSNTLRISQVAGTNNGVPALNFNPPVTPFQFTINNILRPLFNSPSADFVFEVENTDTRAHDINLGGVWR